MMVLINEEQNIKHIREQLDIAEKFLNAANYAETETPVDTDGIMANLKRYREKMAEIKRFLD